MTTPTVLAEGFACAESPRWHAGELYFSDMYGHAVIAVTEAGSTRIVAEVPEVPTGLGWLPDGRLLIATQRGRRVLRQEPDGTLVTHADLAGVTISNLNDMWVDSQGRAYVGELGFDAEALFAEIVQQHTSREAAVNALMTTVREQHPGRIHLIEPNGEHRIVDSATILPNGMTVDPDETHLYINASLAPAVLRFDVAPDGTLTAKTVITDLTFPPDGMSALDTEGGFWIADAEGHAALRLTPDGDVTDRIETDRKCLAVALGGTDGNTLFLCTTHNNDEHESVNQRGSQIATVRVTTPLAI
ncbi:SMP-30/gluconolactonase/LRE family protein [Amycolatopsis sp. NBC_01480]|uniref:SMP-30/gluconolactonase/LRE family protein n=1 Tax=Amycolatopsis sp. NBC_01480 TaxID=2903562 RepID=UPI002E2CC69E|nr:SMP-30/gluconolactonase/LRE family protein [Amycolatopsis sp. NBC_01480]